VLKNINLKQVKKYKLKGEDKMGKIFFISDTHFYHANILKYESRPFKNINEMNETIIKNWNNKVSKNDEVYVLGDFSFGDKYDTLQLLDNLNGKKYLIKGNHDYVIKDREVQQKFEWIKDYFMLKHNKMKFVLFHYPIQVWDCKHHNSIHLYGHVHSNLNRSMEYDIKNSYNVGADVNKFTPIELNEVLQALSING
jgi:calcineurin-like phosphoesterase family protein